MFPQLPRFLLGLPANDTHSDLVTPDPCGALLAARHEALYSPACKQHFRSPSIDSMTNCRLTESSLMFHENFGTPWTRHYQALQIGRISFGSIYQSCSFELVSSTEVACSLELPLYQGVLVCLNVWQIVCAITVSSYSAT